MVITFNVSEALAKSGVGWVTLCLETATGPVHQAAIGKLAEKGIIMTGLLTTAKYIE